VACALWNSPKPLRREIRSATRSVENLNMLWYIGLFFLSLWIIEKFLLHKGGFIHTLLIAGIGCLAVQLVQHLRTREYERSVRH
jgi:uncharacterized membrane protein YiaA